MTDTEIVLKPKLTAQKSEIIAIVIDGLPSKNSQGDGMMNQTVAVILFCSRSNGVERQEADSFGCGFLDHDKELNSNCASRRTATIRHRDLE
jgi:hypothetical protein